MGKLGEGLLGTFWELGSAHGRPLRAADGVPGHIQFRESSVVIKVLETRGDLESDLRDAFQRDRRDQEPKAGRWVFGVTEAGSVIIPSIGRERETISFGSRPTVRTYVSSSVIVGVDPSEAFGPRILELSVRLPNPEWADLNPLSYTFLQDKQRKINGVDIHLRNRGPIACGTVHGFKIEIKAGWLHKPGSERDPTQQVVGLDVTTRSKRPRTLEEHLDVVLRVQDLMSLAYDGFLPAISARVRIEGKSTNSPALWNSELFDEGDATDHDRGPFFKLEDISPQALARWVMITRRNANTADTIRVAYRAPRPPASRIVELGAGIEQFVAQAKRNARAQGRPAPGWTTARGKDSGGAPGTLARYAGAPFRAFVGDPTVWASRFLDAYNWAKHDPGREPEHVRMLTSSGQLLIATILLNRIGRSHAASSKLLTDYRLDSLRRALQQL